MMSVLRSSQGYKQVISLSTMSIGKDHLVPKRKVSWKWGRGFTDKDSDHGKKINWKDSIHGWDSWPKTCSVETLESFSSAGSWESNQDFFPYLLCSMIRFFKSTYPILLMSFHYSLKNVCSLVSKIEGALSWIYYRVQNFLKCSLVLNLTEVELNPFSL